MHSLQLEITGWQIKENDDILLKQLHKNYRSEIIKLTQQTRDVDPMLV